jgi:ribosomal protein L9
VNQAQIAAALRQKGFPIEERQIRLDQPLKEIGVVDVPLVLHQGVETTIKVWVVQQKPQ